MPLLLPIGDFIPLLIDLVADDDPEIRLFTIELLGELRPRRAESYPALDLRT